MILSIVVPSILWYKSAASLPTHEEPGPTVRSPFTKTSLSIAALALVLFAPSGFAQRADATSSASTKPAAAQASAAPSTAPASTLPSAAPSAAPADTTSTATQPQTAAPAPDTASSATPTGAEATSSASVAPSARAELYWHALYDIALGPAFILAWILFALGFVRRILQLGRITRRTGTGFVIPNPRPDRDDKAFLYRGRSGLGLGLYKVRRWLRRTVFWNNPVTGAASLLFHLAIFLIPLLLPAHNALIYKSLRVSLPSLPAAALDKATLGLFALGAFFLLRRIFLPRVRALSTLRDYLVLLLVAAPFVTAYMAHHHWLDYRTVLIAHVIFGEALIAAIPFTKLGHMPFLIFSRFFASSEYAWKPGNRRW